MLSWLGRYKAKPQILILANFGEKGGGEWEILWGAAILAVRLAYNLVTNSL